MPTPRHPQGWGVRKTTSPVTGAAPPGWFSGGSVMGRLPDPERAALHRNLDPLLSLLLTTVTAEGKMEGLQGKTITVVHVRWTTDLRLCVRDGSPIYGCACAMDHRCACAMDERSTVVRARWITDLRLCVRDGSPIYCCAWAMGQRSTVVCARWITSASYME